MGKGYLDAELSWNGKLIRNVSSSAPSEWAVLRELYRPGRRSPVELGQVIGMTKGGASKLIDRLVKKGLVRKEVSEFDRRFRGVELTEYGREWVPFGKMGIAAVGRLLRDVRGGGILG